MPLLKRTVVVVTYQNLFCTSFMYTDIINKKNFTEIKVYIVHDKQIIQPNKLMLLSAAIIIHIHTSSKYLQTKSSFVTEK